MTSTTQKTKYVPEHLKKWSKNGPTGFDSASNYLGSDMGDCYVAPISITRDTQCILELSNWKVQEEALDDLIESDESGIHRFGHWGPGWYEVYLINESDYAALKEADDLCCSLEQYAVLDEDNYNDLLIEAQGEEYERYYAEEFYKKFSDYVKNKVDDSVFEQFNTVYDEDDYVEDLIKNAAERVGLSVEAYLYGKFYECMNRNNVYWEDRNDGVSIDIDRVCKFQASDVSDIFHAIDKDQLALF